MGLPVMVGTTCTIDMALLLQQNRARNAQVSSFNPITAFYDIMPTVKAWTFTMHKLQRIEH